MKLEIAANNHRNGMKGSELNSALLNLTRNFKKIVLPGKGIFLNSAAIANNHGMVYKSEAQKNNKGTFIKTAAITAGMLVAHMVKKQRQLNKQRQMQNLLDFEYNF